MNIDDIIEYHLERDFKPFKRSLSEEEYKCALMDHYKGYNAFVIKSSNDDNAGPATKWCNDKFGWNTGRCMIGLGVWSFENPKDAVEFKLKWCGNDL